MFERIQKIIQSGKIQEFFFPVGVAACIIVILVPLDSRLMDFLLALNITIGMLILFTTVFVTRPLDFNVFPTVLLATTLFRLVLNIATTRLILSNAGTEGIFAGGKVIKAFSEFVSGDSLVVGLIIFIIIIVIQFVVITKGAGRVAEVAARFTLDAMPGKQMAIDADLNAGLIDEAEAKKRREEITQSADFFGAMDGASKFVRGDAIAGVVITIINILAGLLIGVVQYGMPIMEALDLYTKLTIGDGLVSQVPSLLISIGTGILVTRGSASENLSVAFFTQIGSRPIVLVLSACFLAILTLTNLPKEPLIGIAISCIGLAYVLNRGTKEAKAEEKTRREEEKAEKEAEKEDRIEDYLVIDPMELEIGVGLISLADPGRGGDLLDRIHRIRQNVAADIGIILPRVRIRDSFQLDQLQYRVKIAGMPVALGMVYPDLYLAMDSGEALGQIQGIQTSDPAFGTPALWIDSAAHDQAELYGYTVVEPGAVIATHLTETIRKHADELLTRDATQHLLDELKQTSPAVVDELIPGVMKLGQVQQILQMLLREQIPIRQLGTILETLGDYASRTRDPILLTEYVRARMARTICTRYRDSEDTMHVVMFDPALEDQIRGGFEHGEQGMFIRFSPQAIDHLCTRIQQEIEKLTRVNHPPIVLVNPQIRAALKQMTASALPHLIVLSYNEITRDTKIDSTGMVSL